MQIALISNGEIRDHQTTTSLVKSHQLVYAVDGGFSHCQKMGIVPDMVIGDFDSIDPDVLKNFPEDKILRFPQEKDETDLELAILEALKTNPERITVFGALEKKTDHLLGNLFLLLRHPGKIYLENEEEILFGIVAKTQLPCETGQTLSLIPLGEKAEGVTTKGLKWELNEATLDSGFMSISNICLQTPAIVDLSKGSLICSITKQNLKTQEISSKT